MTTERKKLVFATNNTHKAEEMAAILGNSVEILTLQDLGCQDDIPETADTLEGNARLKAEYIHRKYHLDCFADDTGLEVDALNGAPGVHSARYAGGKGHDSEANVRKLLAEMQHTENRKARFRTVICLIAANETHTFDGIVEGEITRERYGTGGFGYDCVFRPEGHDQTFAQMQSEAKNQISHRAKAVAKLCEFLCPR